MRHLSAMGAVFLGMFLATTASGGEARAAKPSAAKPSAAKPSAAKPSATRDAKASADRASPAHGKRVAAKGSAGAAAQARRRSGSGEGGKTAKGEVVGGLAGHKAPGAHAAGARAARSGASGAAKATGSHHRMARVLPAVPKPPCLHDAVEFERGFGGDLQSVVLTRCDGRPAPNAVEQLSVLVRPMNAPKPTLETTPIRHGASRRDGSPREWLPGVKLVNDGLVARLQQVVDHFHPKKVTVVSGYRPTSLGSFHQSARAIDFHLDGVGNEALVAFCRTLPDTGCGFYPNSSFVHMDVRAAGTGHVYWIDASGPGEPARYVATWPPRDGATQPTEIPRPDPAAPLDEQTHVDSRIHLAPGASDTKIDARTTAPLSAGDGKDDPFAP